MKKQGLFSLLRLLAICVLAAVIGINVYTFNASRLAGNAFPMPLGFGLSVVLSGSMEPELSTGDLLLVVAREEYKPDEVVVFLDGRSAVVHRIISMDGDTVITQGDANNQADEPISTELICGKVVLAIPLVGYLVSVIKTPLGTLLILALAVWLLNRSFRREQKEKTEQLDMIRAEIERLKAEQAERTKQADQEKRDRE
jgi:signal peptidase